MAQVFYKKKKAFVLYALIAFALYLMILTPSTQGPWKPEYKKLPYVDIQGRELVVHNIRDTKYSEQGLILEQKYRQRTYHLDNLKQIWFGLSHFGAYGLAHSFLSFEFTDGDYLVLSVEARLKPKQAYNPVVGAFRQYNKIFVLSTEQDVIGLRTHIRGERVLLYPTTVDDKVELERFLLALLNETNELHQEPDFYNTFLDNCLTNLLKHVSIFDELSATDFRVLLPGHSDRLTYALGITPDDISFDEARTRATVQPVVTQIEAEDYSQQIRCGWHKYKQLSFPKCPE